MPSPKLSLLSLTPRLDSFDFPQYCLAKAQRVWWPARCTGYTPPSPSKSGKAKGKFTIEWTDGKSTKIARSSLLLPREPNFFTVPVRSSDSRGRCFR